MDTTDTNSTQQTITLQAVAAELTRLSRREVRGLMLMRHDMGVRVRAVNDDQRRYGRVGVDRLAKYFGRSPSYFYDMMTFADAFAREEVEHLAQLTLPGGGLVTYHHLLAIARVHARPRQRHWLAHLLAEGGTARQLVVDIGAADGRRRRRGHRKPTRPSSPTAGLQRIIVTSRAFCRFVPVFFETCTDVVDRMPAADFSPTLVARLTEARDEMVRLEEVAGAYRERAAAVLERVARTAAAPARLATPADGLVEGAP
jgi:hypothetical protein